MIFNIKPIYEEEIINHYIFSTVLYIPNITNKYYPIEISNKVTDGNKTGFIEIKRELTEKGLEIKFRLNTWFPIAEDLIFDKLEITVKWSVIREDGLLEERHKNFNFYFDNDKLKELFSNKSKNAEIKQLDIKTETED